MSYTPKPSKKHPGWVEVPGYPYFLANKEGKVRNAKTGYETFGSLDDKGYRRVCQWDNGTKTKKEYKAHHIVCTAFHGPCPSPRHEVGHRDDDRANNTPSNLRWVTRKENMTKANKKRVSTESDSLSSAYVGRTLDEASRQMLMDLQSRLGLNNPIPPGELHLTMLYSPEHPLQGYTPSPRPIDSVGEWELEHLDDGRAVAIILKGDSGLQQRHKELLEMGGKHTYTPYMAHISLSYDDTVTEQVAKSIKWDVSRKLTFIGEYLEPIEEEPSMESFLSVPTPKSLHW